MHAVIRLGSRMAAFILASNTLSKTIHFRSGKSYHKWLAYAKMHTQPGKSPKRIVIAGKPHRVIHVRRKGV